ncbi:MAG TPA: glycosyltransferase family 2 protein [Gaiellaceae bacterium]|nr:glycosyltransferase family 2 protein [Gaiellaceae bacterium]
MDHVAVVVLSWNGREDTLQCLESLRNVDYRPLTPIVVDNGSTDGTSEAVRAAFPEVDIVRTEENLGFAEGNNVGMRRALELGADYVLVLNNDVEVDPGFVAPLVEEARGRPEAGALCSKILYMEPDDLIWFAGATFDPRSGYNGRQIGYRERDDGRFEDVTETDRACGAAMLVSREVLEQVGLFDAELFFYSEDVDWSLRARDVGYRHYVVPASKLWHKVSVTSGGENSPTTLYYGVRNTTAVCERFAPLGRLGTWRRRSVLLAAHLAQALRSSRKREGIAAVLQGWRDFRRNRFAKRPLRGALT